MSKNSSTFSSTTTTALTLSEVKEREIAKLVDNPITIIKDNKQNIEVDEANENNIKLSVTLKQLSSQIETSKNSSSKISNRNSMPNIIRNSTTGKASQKELNSVNNTMVEMANGKLNQSEDNAQISNAETINCIKNVDLKKNNDLLEHLLLPLDDQFLLKSSEGLDSPNFLNCSRNEFGAIEIELSKENVKIATNEEEDIDLTCREDVPLSPNKEKLDSKKPRNDELLCCEGCGCYGMFGDFIENNCCSDKCKKTIKGKVKEKLRKERELFNQRLRREAKRKKKELEAKEKKIEITEKVEQSNNDCGDEANDLNLPSKPIENCAVNAASDESTTFNISRFYKVKQPSSHFNNQYPWYDPVKGVCWEKYLQESNSMQSACFIPNTILQNSFPKLGSENFEIGMKLEAIDPEHPSLICVVTIVEIIGTRLRLHFDGYSNSHDFWEECASPYIFCAGWAYSNNLKLSPPLGFDADKFQWHQYLSKTKSIAAPIECFPTRQKMEEISDWEIGMKLEAVDKSNTSMVCVASVTSKMDGRILIHFDGWEIDYDYWVVPSASPYIHPVGWCQENQMELNPPKNYNGSEPFTWSNYLSSTGSQAAPSHAFKASNEASKFEKGYKVEAVDKRNPVLIRVATVAEVVNRQLRIHYDGWPDEFDVWMDDESLLIYPPNWCFNTGHPLMPPLTPEEIRHCARSGCPSPGCRNIGHVQGSKYNSHLTPSGCPYSKQNLESIEPKFPDRLHETSTDNFIDNVKIVEEHDDSLSALSEDIEGLGRGNRRRKRRRFFDEDENESNKKDSVQKKLCTEETNFQTAPPDIEVQFDITTDDIFLNRNYLYKPKVTSSPFVVAAKNLNVHSVLKWSSTEVSNFISSLPQLDEIVPKIITEEIDGEAFLLLTSRDMVKALDMKLGPALKLFNTISLIRENQHDVDLML